MSTSRRTALFDFDILYRVLNAERYSCQPSSNASGREHNGTEPQLIEDGELFTIRLLR